MATVLVPPLSKSDAQRALVLAEVWGLPLDSMWAAGEVLPRDVEVLRGGLEALRRQVSAIDCRDGGAPFRFLLTQAALMPNRTVTFTGTARLGERPHGPLIQSLRSALGDAGLSIEQGDPWPVVVHSPVALHREVHFTVTGEESSQYASSLLLGAARVARVTGKPCRVTLAGDFTSEGYLTMTLAWLARAGFEVSGGPSVVVRAGARAPASLAIPGDWSSLTYLLVLAWRTGAAVDRVDFEAAHPDRAVVQHLEEIGLEVSRSSPARVTGAPVRGLEVDAQACPDAVPTLAVLAAVLPRPSVFRRVGILRHKESDRLEAVQRLLAAAGRATRVDGEALVVEPGAVHHFSFDARDDHRMVMAAAVLGVLGGVRAEVHGRDAVAKSFPGFFAELAKLGA